jgi:hypothetical protein
MQRHPDYFDDNPFMLNPGMAAEQPLIKLKVVTNQSTGETNVTLGMPRIYADWIRI